MRPLMSCAILFAGMVGTLSADSGETVSMRYRSYRNWTINLPVTKWMEVTDGIQIPHPNGDSFPVALEGLNLKVDTDGDGKLDRTIKPATDIKTGVSTARVILTSSSKDGDEFRYAVRLKKDGGGWEWFPGGAMFGTVNTEAGPVPIRVIDQNGNGKFNDFGQDALLVGVSDDATFLSKTVIVDGQLRQLGISEDGLSVTLSEFSGPTAKLDMTTSFDSRALLLSAIIRSADGKNSFNLGMIDGPVDIPAGSYNMISGAVGLGQHRVYIGPGQMQPLKLAAGTSQEFDWGGPARSEFRYERQGARVRFTPQKIWYFGAAGEEYFGWAPVGKSPEFTIRNADTGVVIEVAILPGSC